MPALFIYLIKVNVALLIFCAGYYAVLRHLTFYNLNRVYLVTAIIFSTLYPLMDVAAFLDRHEEIAKPVQVVIINWQQPVKEIGKTFLGHDIWFWMLAAFWAGVALFGVRLGMQLFSLYKLHKRSQPFQVQQYVVRVIEGDINPFSFWQNIYINPQNHPERELGAILEHEQIHVKEWHTLDILLGELSTIFYWFNPGVWLMKRAIRENIEFITDQKILMKGVDRKDYQYSLLNVNMGAQNSAIVNNFNMSTIKKRIMMMNAKRSSKVNITRYLLLVPVVMVLLLIFSVSKAEVKKVAKTSQRVMQAITIAVKDMVTIDEPAKPEEKEFVKKKKISRPLTVILQDSMELPRIVPQFHFETRQDTIKKNSVDITQLYRGLNLSPNNKVTKLRLDGQDIPEVYINGEKSSKELSDINPDDISDISIFRGEELNSKGSIHIVTKNMEEVTVTGVRLKDSLLIKNKVKGVILRGKPTVANVTITAIPTGSSTAQGYPISSGKMPGIWVTSGDTIRTNDIKISREKGEPALTEVVVMGRAARQGSADTVEPKSSAAKILTFKSTFTILRDKVPSDKK